MSRLRVALPALILCATLLLVAGALWFGAPSKKPGLRLQLTPDIAVELTAVLTKGNATYGDRSLIYKAYSALPRSARREWRHYIGEPKSGGQFEANLSGTQIGLIFHVSHPPNYIKSPISSSSGVSDKLKAVFEKAGYDALHLKFSEGVYSAPEPFPGFHTYWSDHDDSESFFFVTISDVPLTVPELSLEFLDRDQQLGTAPDRIVRSFKFKNPIYTTLNPASPIEPMPASKSKNGVEVTLRKVVTCSVDPNDHRDGRQGKMFEAAQTDGEFLRARGTMDDPFSTLVLLDLEGNGKEPEWKLKDVRFSYGAKEHRFNSKKMVPVQISSFPEPDRYLMGFQPDVSVLGGPVKVSVDLVKRGNFDPDEIQTVDLTLPTTGTISTIQEAKGFWEGPIGVAVGNKVDLNWRGWKTGRVYQSAPYLQSILLIARPDVDRGLTSATLTAEDGTVVDVTNRMNLASESTIRGLTVAKWYLDYARSAPEANMEPIDITQFTTISLTVNVPRSKSFDFIVDPEEARGKGRGSP